MRSRTIRAVAVVKDLFFVARIRETARLVGTELTFARTPEELEARLRLELPAVVIIDLTTAGWDFGAFFDTLDAASPPPPVLGFTTHVLARQTQPFHGRCRRVLTKEALTRELGRILAEGIAA